MKVILRILGKQSDKDLSFISSEHAVAYVRDLESAAKAGEDLNFLKSKLNKFRQQLKRQELPDLLSNLLSLNPYFRMTSLECILNFKMFDSIRDQYKEAGLKKMAESKHSLIELDIDSQDAFDYEDASKAKYSVDQLL
jgi:hypothetical protein